jgi:hypothetical protein
MGDQPQKKSEYNSEYKKEADLKELILSLQGLLKFLLNKWKIIVVVMLIGAILGGIYAKSKDYVFTATSTFVLENGQAGGGMNGLSLLGLAGKANSGLFDESDNIIWLYKTQKMIQKSLLSVGKKDGKDIVMIEWFMDASGLRKKIKKSAPALAKLKFNPNDDFSNLSVDQNSLLGWCVGEVLGKSLSIKKVEKTENIISVSILSEDERFAKTFNDILVSEVNSYYIETKTLKAVKEVSILEYKLDSFKAKMNSAMVQVAAATDNVPYANPNQQMLRVAPQKKSIEVQIESALYVEIAKNLEISKMDLAKITPIIKVIEAPNFPLSADKPTLQKWVVMGGMLAALLSICVLGLLYFYHKVMAT